MRLLEYEAKQLLAMHGAPIPAGQLITNTKGEPLLPLPLIVKVQIPVGGRGKAGGVRPVYTRGEFHDASKELLGQPILGYRPNLLLAEEMFEARREIYLAVAIDRPGRTLMLLAHRNGGVEIETAAHESEMLRLELAHEPDEQTIQKVLEYLGLIEMMREPLGQIVATLWKTATQEDALLVEINPLILTQDERLVCADAKIELDDSAAFRHSWNFDQKPASSQFVILNEQGNMGSMANGAGLAMATVDAIKNAGALPANFLDIGGGADARSIAEAFKRLAELPNVRAIIINVFGGITRCDEVANAVVMARNTVPDLPRICIRLTGTNEEKGRAILEAAGITTLPDLNSCIDAATLEIL